MNNTASEGYKALHRAAAEYGTEKVCPRCGNPEIVKARNTSGLYCGECNVDFFDAENANLFQEALVIWNDRTHAKARFEHIHILCDHAENLHLKVLELEELLKIERDRLASSQRVVNETAALLTMR